MNQDKTIKTIFEYDENNAGHIVPPSESIELPAELKRDNLPIPDVSEINAIRHFTNLSRKNFGIEVGFYPLGSCTMKYNPKINEDVARLPGFAKLHPAIPDRYAQGALGLMWELQEYLKQLTGMDEVTLQPAAGSQCELLGAMIAKKYFKEKKEDRKKIIIPDAAHGTNPATSAMCNCETITIPSDSRGNMDFEKFKAALTPEVALVMLTNPNTLGLFDEKIEEICELARENGTLMYCDGANMNALLGISKPRDQGFDMVHLNLHKTFSTPHGGGGPGGGALGVRSFLSDYLPTPTIAKDQKQNYSLSYDKPKSVGRVHSFYGNFGILVRAYAYIRSWGSNIKRISDNAVLNANYLLTLLKNTYNLPFDRSCAHEFVISASNLGEKSTAHIAKRLLDYGFHAPTIYFPLIVKEALMVEPTETESKETLDVFAQAMEKIAKELKDNKELVEGAPYTTPVGRLDEVKAARTPNLRWQPKQKES